MTDGPFIERHPFGYGTAIGVVLLLLTLVLSIISLRLTRRDTLEY